jgi:hypothetical protein
MMTARGGEHFFRRKTQHTTGLTCLVCISFLKQLGFSVSAVNKIVKNCHVIEENYGKCWRDQKYVKKSKSEELEETVCKTFHGVSQIILSCIMIWCMFSL